MKREKVSSVSKITNNIKNSIEQIAYGTSMFISLIALQLNLFDFTIDGSFDNLYTHPIKYTSVVLSPVIIGALIKKLDPKSETANDINEMINDLKPKIRKR